MRFDRNAPGGGVEAVYRLENGKAFLEWKLYLTEDGGEQRQAADEEQQNRDVAGREQGWEVAWTQHGRESAGREQGWEVAWTQHGRESAGREQDWETGEGRLSDREATGKEKVRETIGVWQGWERDEEAEAQIRIYVTDEDNNVILECRQQLREEEPLESILLQPRLWRGVEGPYLYHVEAILADGDGCCRDRVHRGLGLRNLSCRQSGGFALNGMELEPRAVKYFLPDKGRAADCLWQMEKDMELLLRLGANCICLEEIRDWKEELCRDFLQLCDRFGFLAFGKKKGGLEYAWMQESGIGAGLAQREAIIIGSEVEMPILRRGSRDFIVDSENKVRDLKDGNMDCVMQSKSEVEVSILRGEKRDSAVDREDESRAVGGKKMNCVMQCESEVEMSTLRGGKSDSVMDCKEASSMGGPEKTSGQGRQRGQALLPDGEHPGPLFYRYLAEWGRQPFVHIVPESIMRMESGNYTALCYSNCDKVALYSDGLLFEFQSGEREFRFREIPAKTPCIMLAAEGDGCGESLSVHKSFVKRMEK